MRLLSYILIYVSLIWTFASSNPIPQRRRNRVEEEFLKSYFGSGFNFRANRNRNRKIDDTKDAINTSKNYATIRGRDRSDSYRSLSLQSLSTKEFAATGRQLQQSTKKSTFLPVQPVYNPRESRKTIVNQSHSRVKMFNNLDAEFYYKNIENMIRKKSGLVQNPTTQFESSTDFGRPRGVPLAYPLGYALIDENQEIGKYEAKTINGVQEILPKN